MQHKALAPRQLAHSPFTPVKVFAKIQLESQTLPRLRVARMGVNCRLPLIPLVRRYIPLPSYSHSSIYCTPVRYITVPYVRNSTEQDGAAHKYTVRTAETAP